MVVITELIGRKLMNNKVELGKVGGQIGTKDLSLPITKKKQQYPKK